MEREARVLVGLPIGVYMYLWIYRSRPCECDFFLWIGWVGGDGDGGAVIMTLFMDFLTKVFLFKLFFLKQLVQMILLS